MVLFKILILIQLFESTLLLPYKKNQIHLSCLNFEINHSPNLNIKF
jgi:hypothetical protein